MKAKNPIQDRPIRIAVVGCGRIAANHIAAIAKHAGRIELAAVCDNNPKALEAAVAKTGVKGYSDLSELLAAASTDVVALCTPSGLHSGQAVQCAQAGVHVMTEKPMATRWADGIAMVDECDRAGVRLFVVKQNRRNATLSSW